MNFLQKLGADVAARRIRATHGRGWRAGRRSSRLGPCSAPPRSVQRPTSAAEEIVESPSGRRPAPRPGLGNVNGCISWPRRSSAGRPEPLPVTLPSSRPRRDDRPAIQVPASLAKRDDAGRSATSSPRRPSRAPGRKSSWQRHAHQRQLGSPASSPIHRRSPAGSAPRREPLRSPPPGVPPRKSGYLHL